MHLITIVTPIDNFCGKSFTLDSEGKIKKGRASVTARAKARHVTCNNLEDLANIINSLDTGEAIILGSIADFAAKGINNFYLISEREMAKLTGVIAQEDAPLTHEIDGAHLAQRKKKLFKRAPFFCIDRDVDEEVPENIKRVQELSNSEFLRVLCQELGPDVSRAFTGSDFLAVTSSSGQVYGPNGEPYSKDPSAHLYFKVEDPADLDRFAVVLMANAFGSGFMYEKQINRKDDIKAFRRCTIFDPSVFTIGRLFFESAPKVGPGLELRRSPCSVISWDGKAVNTKLVPEPNGEILLALDKQNLTFRRNGKLGSHLESETLNRYQQIETKNGLMTPDQFERSGIDRLRCQSPFRHSISWAAYLSRHDDGSCFLFDTGTNIKYQIEPEPVNDDFSDLLLDVKNKTREALKGDTSHIEAAREEYERTERTEADNIATELTKAIKDIAPVPPSVLSGVYDFGDDVRYGVPFLIQNYIPMKSVGVVFGPAGSFKSFGVLDMGLSVAYGLPKWCGNKIADPGLVMYFSGEGKSGLGGRVKAWMKKNKISSYSPNFRYFDQQLAFTGENALYNAQKVIDTAKEAQGLTGSKPRLVVFDTLARAMGDGDENKAADMQSFCNMAELIRDELDCCVLIVHHTQKNYSKSAEMKARGSGALSGAVDFEYVYYRVSEEERKKELDIFVSKNEFLLKMENRKMKDAKEPAPLHLKAVIVETGTVDNFGEAETVINIEGPAYGGIADIAIEEVKEIAGDKETEVIRGQLMQFLHNNGYKTTSKTIDIAEAARCVRPAVRLGLGEDIKPAAIIEVAKKTKEIGSTTAGGIWLKANW